MGDAAMTGVDGLRANTSYDEGYADGLEIGREAARVSAQLAGKELWRLVVNYAGNMADFCSDCPSDGIPERMLASQQAVKDQIEKMTGVKLD